MNNRRDINVDEDIMSLSYTFMFYVLELDKLDELDFSINDPF